MGCRRHDLQEAFFVPGDHGFRVWGYGTADPLADLLQPGYFAVAGSLLRPGELIYVACHPADKDTAANGTTGVGRQALLMVAETGRGGTRVRLVQDFGGPASGDTARPAAAPADAARDGRADDTGRPAGSSGSPAPPARRGRGRPPGSRTRKRA